MLAAIWTVVVGPLMWVPGLNIIVGALAFGWQGALVGLVITLLAGSAGSKSENVNNAAKSAAKKAKEWWQVLGVKPDATADEIKRAYRDKAKKAHPDVGGNAKRMADINAARDAGLGKYSV